MANLDQHCGEIDSDRVAAYHVAVVAGRARLLGFEGYLRYYCDRMSKEAVAPSNSDSMALSPENSISSPASE